MLCTLIVFVTQSQECGFLAKQKWKTFPVSEGPLSSKCLNFLAESSFNHTIQNIGELANCSRNVYFRPWKLVTSTPECWQTARKVNQWNLWNPGSRKKNVENSPRFLYNASSTVNRVWSSVIDFSLHLLLAHWPGRELRASGECSLFPQGQFLWQVHCLPLWKHFNEATDRWSSKEQGSVAEKWVTEPSDPFTPYSPSSLTDKTGERRRKRHFLHAYMGMSVSHWFLLFSDAKQLLTLVPKANATVMKCAA